MLLAHIPKPLQDQLRGNGERVVWRIRLVPSKKSSSSPTT